MIKTFWHINEFGESGWSYLPVIAALSSPITLWAPSGIMLKTAFEKGLSPISPRDLLDLVSDGKVKIAGRPNWIDGEAWRTKDLTPGEFYGRKWLPGFDDEIKKIYEYKNDLDVVIITDKEHGYEWADKCIDERSVHFRTAANLAKTLLVPQGTLERIKRIKDSEKKNTKVKIIREIIRDSYNHERAKKDLGCNLSFEIGEHNFIEFDSLHGIKTSDSKLKREIWDMNRVLDLVEFVKSLGTINNISDLMKIIDNKKIKSELESVLLSKESIEKLVYDGIYYGYKPKNDLNTYFGGHLYIGAASLLTSVLGFLWAYDDTKGALQDVNRRQFLVKSVASTVFGVVGTVSSVIPIYDQEMKEHNLKPADGEYTGYIFPFLFAYNTSTPTRREIEKLKEHISKKL